MAKRQFLDTSMVADKLRWHPNTIRDNLVPVAEWEPGSPKIPCIKIGGRYLIPRWWLDDILAIGEGPPEPNTEKTG